jgi:NTP pyrophosphatase (non-canonical NTP hydrolase)
LSFQRQVNYWCIACFGQEITSDTKERNHRFLEEGLELVQTCGCTQEEAHQLVDYVFGRPLGEVKQEMGGVMVTLAALANAQQISMEQCGDDELARVWTKIEKIRAKQAAKPQFSSLPE